MDSTTGNINCPSDIFHAVIGNQIIAVLRIRSLPARRHAAPRPVWAIQYTDLTRDTTQHSSLDSGLKALRRMARAEGAMVCRDACSKLA